MTESFGPEYVRPAQKECPRCGCCSAALCERGRDSVMRCQGHTDEVTRATVAGCPCSAETTRGTAAWRAGQVRVTRLARELPVPPQAEALLRALAAGVTTPCDEEVFKPLQLRGLVQAVHGMPAITPFGSTYLAGRDDERAVTAVRVLDVDKRVRSARVEVAAWQAGVPVTVLMDQITTDTGLDADSLPGRWLEAEANCQAEHLDRLVLTGFRAAAPLPQGWTPEGGEPGE